MKLSNFTKKYKIKSFQNGAFKFDGLEAAIIEIKES